MNHYSDPSSRSSCSGSSFSPAEAPTHSPFNSHIRTSCDACKRLKIKCEKNGDSCAHCLNRGITCATTLAERKKRQPTRSWTLDASDALLTNTENF
ncbi:hypothetical protein ASPVEDRAFT_47484 [Aspergillus versicolor CBS 583.65]|uniref:Zn(2)-C6 fungal-type domain-containing protein n=1 Tax=Aspergillus versicolor CBS 583.65 TaxID=1036611 RepID=A0A1L9Q3M3_ASPVE|nr:uncharacterized protein ASPVEDRAFT_47484 [Aspergillus versicolor CBS 583.65]OJJ08322.1 hypothetical protein ASPVEDRAFT_47484 [Aspergillus versicolor CBS 583.65]